MEGSPVPELWSSEPGRGRGAGRPSIWEAAWVSGSTLSCFYRFSPSRTPFLGYDHGEQNNSKTKATAMHKPCRCQYPISFNSVSSNNIKPKCKSSLRKHSFLFHPSQIIHNKSYIYSFHYVYCITPLFFFISHLFTGIKAWRNAPSTSTIHHNTHTHII